MVSAVSSMNSFFKDAGNAEEGLGPVRGIRQGLLLGQTGAAGGLPKNVGHRGGAGWRGGVPGGRRRRRGPAAPGNVARDVQVVPKKPESVPSGGRGEVGL